MKIALAHPGVGPFVQQAARALLEAGLRESYWTTFADRPEASWRRAIVLVASAFGIDIDRELGRRTVEEVPSSVLRTWPHWEIARTLLARIGVDPRLVDTVWEQEILRFDRNLAILRTSKLAKEAGIADAISFLPSAPPDQMARLAAQHDVGLASELSTPPNRAISLTNKVFTYLLGGIPVLLSNTPAQRDLAKELGDAAQMVDLAAPDMIAAHLDLWASNPQTLWAAKMTAWQLGQTRFNWDTEKRKFLHAVTRAQLIGRASASALVGLGEDRSSPCHS